MANEQLLTYVGDANSGLATQEQIGGGATAWTYTPDFTAVDNLMTLINNHQKDVWGRNNEIADRIAKAAADEKFYDFRDLLESDQLPLAQTQEDYRDYLTKEAAAVYNPTPENMAKYQEAKKKRDKLDGDVKFAQARKSIDDINSKLEENEQNPVLKKEIQAHRNTYLKDPTKKATLYNESLNMSEIDKLGESATKFTITVKDPNSTRETNVVAKDLAAMFGNIKAAYASEDDKLRRRLDAQAKVFNEYILTASEKLRAATGTNPTNQQVIEMLKQMEDSGEIKKGTYQKFNDFYTDYLSKVSIYNTQIAGKANSIVGKDGKTKSDVRQLPPVDVIDITNGIDGSEFGQMYVTSKHFSVSSTSKTDQTNESIAQQQASTAARNVELDFKAAMAGIGVEREKMANDLKLKAGLRPDGKGGWLTFNQNGDADQIFDRDYWGETLAALPFGLRTGTPNGKSKPDAKEIKHLKEYIKNYRPDADLSEIKDILINYDEKGEVKNISIGDDYIDRGVGNTRANLIEASKVTNKEKISFGGTGSSQPSLGGSVIVGGKTFITPGN